MMLNEDLPRLLYIGDVPVRLTSAGSSLIYRLLQHYPVDKLEIVETNFDIEFISDKNLPDIKYYQLRRRYSKIIRAKIAPIYRTYCLLTARITAFRLHNIIANFRPEAILTVTHGVSWLTAAEIAKKYNFPLYLILHDDYLSITNELFMGKQLSLWIENEFSRIYQQAKQRFCVSPYMVEMYQNLYGCEGTVLYPCRSPDINALDIRFNNLDQTKKNNRIVFAYAGFGGYVQYLGLLASVLKKLELELVIYSNITQDNLEKFGLTDSHVKYYNMIHPSLLIKKLYKEADVLFVPMSFERELQFYMSIGFPSKLADYTLTGLPLLIWGPSYCSAVRWAKENPGVAEVIERDDIELLTDAIQRLANLQYRRQLGDQAFKVGNSYFDHEIVTNKFQQILVNNTIN